MSSTVGCYDCGLPYGDAGWIEAVVPNDVWSVINPSDVAGGGLLCITCISRRCVEAGLKAVPVMFCGLEPLQPVSCKSPSELQIDIHDDLAAEIDEGLQADDDYMRYYRQDDESTTT